MIDKQLEKAKTLIHAIHEHTKNLPVSYVRDMEVYDDIIDDDNPFRIFMKFRSSLPESQLPLNVFVSGKYTGKTHSEVEQNVALACEYAQAIMLRGHNVFCPHTMTAHWEESAPDIMYGEYISMCKSYIGMWADTIFMLPGSDDSVGARVELDYACKCDIVVYDKIEEVPFNWDRVFDRYGKE